jgi:hypothetical protein
MADGSSLRGVVRPIILAKSLVNVVIMAAAIAGMPPAFSRGDVLTVPMWNVRTSGERPSQVLRAQALFR